ncbi:hypothetical protein FOZ61_010688 [Perkinsus olseni]|uniref:Tetratricopeptide repeat protein 38 n=1 Tax=Perkinsus olseni TaxID=32597 RepID=A0A7J6KXL1_PEROL|nr:hypothetical protein FOZ61_010688 [Perkinsus olseni]
MAPKTKANHGASSVSTANATVVLQANPAKRVRDALSSIQENGQTGLDSQWGHLQMAWASLSYSVAGKDVGPDPAAFHSACKLARHPLATKDDSFGPEEGYANFNYDALRQKLTSATAKVSGPNWPLLLVGLAAYLPETVVDAALREKLRTLLVRTSGEGEEYVDVDSKLLLWGKIGEEVGKDGYDAELVHEYFMEWLDVLKSLYRALVKRWREFQEAESPRDNNPVLLLGRWASLRFRRLPLTQAFSEERRLAARLSSLSDQASGDMSAIKLSFALRRKNLALIVRSCKSVAGNVGVNELARRIEKKAKSETACIDLLQDFVTANSSGTIDEYFGVERFDYTKKEKPTAAVTTNTTSSRSGKTGREEGQQEEVIPRPKHRRTHYHQHAFKSGKSFYEQAQSIPGKSPTAPSTGQAPVGDKQPTLSQKLGVSSNVLQERRQANLCLKCGASGHKTAYGHFYRSWGAGPDADDLFPLKRAQVMALKCGRSDLVYDAIAEIYKRRGSCLSTIPFLSAMVSFGLEQIGDYEAAERVALDGYACEGAAADDIWLDHAVIHSLYFQGPKRQQDALDFFRDHHESWNARQDSLIPFIYTHCFWHWALVLAETGQFDEALRIFDDNLWWEGRETTTGMFTSANLQDDHVIANALGLLWKLQISDESAATALKGRWRSVAAVAVEAPSEPMYPAQGTRAAQSLGMHCARQWNRFP